MGLLNYTTAETNNLLDKVNEMPDEVKDGKTPVFVIGTVSTLDPGMSATASVTLDGTDDQGNPKYKLNLGIPKGLDGAGGGGGGVADSVQWTNVLNKPSWIGSTKPTYTATEVGALPATTIIPSKTSQLSNDSGYTTSSSFKTINGQSIVGSGNIVIESSGGGGTPSGDGGNVKVTNASILDKNTYYAFKPATNGSTEGTFSVIPEANEDRSGLMSFKDKGKLDNLLIRVPLPSGFKDLTAESTDQQVFTMVAELLNSLNANVGSNYPDDKLNVGYYGCLAFALIMNKLSGGEQFTLDNNPVSAAFDVQVPESSGSGPQYPTKGTAAFTYITSGKLRTVSLVITLNSSGDSSTYDFSANVEESGDDTYYLPDDVRNLNSSKTPAEVLAALGGTKGYEDLKQAIGDKKKIYMPSAGLYSYSTQVSACLMIGDVILSYNKTYFASDDITIIVITCNGSEKYTSIKEYYPAGYPLPDSLAALTSSSDSDTISTAVGGESGLKAIIQALKDGNRLVFKSTGENGATTLVYIISAIYSVSDNGDMSLALGYDIYAVIGFSRIGIAIDYTKSSNTFTCVKDTV